MFDLDRKCEECNGAGAVQDLGWAEWHERYRAAYVEAADTPGLAASPAQIAAEAAGPEPTVPEEARCGVCNGAQRVPTAEGQALLDFVERHLFRDRLAGIEATLDRAEQWAAHVQASH